MASTAKTMQSSAKDDLKQEIRQAVVITDNFNQKFLPLTNNRPLVLLPVVNGVLLDYVLQALEENGINETYVFCCSHSQLIRSYVSSSRWSKPDSPMSVSVIISSSSMSMGDIMRELDSKALIRNDFVLINGDVITTYAISSILEEHKKVRQADKNSAITLLYRKAHPTHRTKCKEQDFLIAIESETKRIRYYQRINNQRTFHIPLEVFQENEEVLVHYNLLDSQISICSPCVPPLFSDNFDYQNLDDFVRGLLVNEELLGNTMYVHIAETGYGASISNLYMYDAVSQDMMSRWTYPVVPDMMEFDGHKFTHSRHNIYKETGVEIGQNCTIRQNVVLGKGTKIGKNSSISNSVIGRNCLIGDNTVINGSYLWNSVTIGNNCKLNTCLLDEKVVLKNDVTIEPGCVLGSEVVIDNSITLPSLTKLQAHEFCDEDSFGEDDLDEKDKPNEQACNTELVGEKGQGYVCSLSADSDIEDDDNVEDVWGKPREVKVLNDDFTDSDSSASVGEAVIEDSDADDDGYDDEATFFYKEVVESLQHGLEDEVKSENMILEINSSKHAYNISMKEVNTMLIKGILRLPLISTDETLTAQQYFAAMKTNLGFFRPLVTNYIKSADSQLDCLSASEDFMKSNDNMSPAVIKILHLWYEQDILNENVIFKWFKNLSEDSENIKKQATGFIKWLQEADEETSEDSSGE